MRLDWSRTGLWTTKSTVRPEAVPCPGVNSLEERIAARIHDVLDQMERGGFRVQDVERAVVVGEADDWVAVLTVEDVAHIAAHVATSKDSRR